MNRLHLALILVLLAGGGLAAEPRFRADDGNLWRLDDNPALGAVSGDQFAMGAALAPTAGRWDEGTNALQLISPLLSFHYTWTGSQESTLQLGTAVGPWAGLSLGYRRDDVTRNGVKQSAHQFGMLYRPFDFASAALTLDDAFSTSRVWGAGAAVRPLTLFWPRADWLTLTADGTFTAEQAALERLGGKLSWRGSDLRFWYEPGSRTPGFEVTLGLGPAETTASPFLAGLAFRWSSDRPDLADFGRKVLRIRGTGVLASAAAPATFFSGPRPWDLPGLVAVLDQAAEEEAVAAVAFEDPPTVGGLATAEELRQAIERLKKAGKKVYVHADAYSDSLGYQGWVSAADRISLSPTGALYLTAGGSRRLYYKDFFDKIGIRFVNFAPWETKSANNPFTYSSMPEGERAMLQRFLADQEDLAVSALASGRGSKLSETASALVAHGPWMVAKEAADRGLVDVLENRADFEAFLTKEHPGASLTDQLTAARTRSWGPSATRRTVAVVSLAGSLVPGPGQAARSIGRAAAETLASLRSDGEVKAVILRVDSPGGAVTPSDDLADEVKKTVEAGKPVVVVMGDLAASGGYYLSAPATRIYARPGTLTGSIGVTATFFTAEKALSMLGIGADGVDLAPSSGFLDITRPLSDADKKKWSAMIEAVYDRFLDVVAEGRGLDKAVLEPLARGQIYTGREALALGLVDELGGMEEAAAWMEQELGGPLELRELVPGTVDVWGGFLGSLASAAVKGSDSAALKLASALDQAAAPWAEAVTGIAARGGGPLVWVDAP